MQLDILNSLYIRGLILASHTLCFHSHLTCDFQNHLHSHLTLATSVMAIPQHCSPIHSTARFKHSPTTIPYPFALSPTESTPCPPIFCPHLKHFYAFLSQDPRMRSTNAALDQTSSNAKSHLESLLNRFRGPTMKFSFTKSELRSPEFVFLTNFQKVLTLQVVTAHY